MLNMEQLERMQALSSQLLKAEQPSILAHSTMLSQLEESKITYDNMRRFGLFHTQIAFKKSDILGANPLGVKIQYNGRTFAIRSGKGKIPRAFYDSFREFAKSRKYKTCVEEFVREHKMIDFLYVLREYGLSVLEKHSGIRRVEVSPGEYKYVDSHRNIMGKDSGGAGISVNAVLFTFNEEVTILNREK